MEKRSSEKLRFFKVKKGGNVAIWIIKSKPKHFLVQSMH
jgi:hypothetical protein